MMKNNWLMMVFNGRFFVFAVRENCFVSRLYLGKTGCEKMQLAQDGAHWQGLALTALNLGVQLSKFLCSRSEVLRHQYYCRLSV